MWDKEKEFKRIQKQLKEASNQCLINGIPIFWCAAVYDDGNETRYVMDGLTPHSMGVHLTDDKIPALILEARKGK